MLILKIYRISSNWGLCSFSLHNNKRHYQSANRPQKAAEHIRLGVPNVASQRNFRIRVMRSHQQHDDMETHHGIHPIRETETIVSQS